MHRYLVERAFPPGALKGLDAATKKKVNTNNASVAAYRRVATLPGQSPPTAIRNQNRDLLDPIFRPPPHLAAAWASKQDSAVSKHDGVQLRRIGL